LRSHVTAPQKLPSVTWITIRSIEDVFRAESAWFGDFSQSTLTPFACAAVAHAAASAHASRTFVNSLRDPMTRASL
jgi:hypothetical protein